MSPQRDDERTNKRRTRKDRATQPMDHGRLRWAMNGETIIKTSRFSFNQRLIFQVHWKCFHWCPPPHPPNWCESIRVFPPNCCDLSVQGARADPGDNSRQPGRISHMHKNVQINYSSFSKAKFFLFFSIISYVFVLYHIFIKFTQLTGTMFTDNVELTQ